MIRSTAVLLLTVVSMGTLMPEDGFAAGMQGHQGHQQHQGADQKQPYAGQQERRIKSLSETDMEELRAGKGWGLALSAELNGWPGPAHLLELAAEIGLSTAQIEQVREMHTQMAEEARQAGARFIAAEERLDRAFADRAVDAGQLRALVDAAGAARADLRYVHLSRHLQTAALLSAEQIAAYNRLRGYAPDPCDMVPEGHDPEMWRMHNSCK